MREYLCLFTFWNCSFDLRHHFPNDVWLCNAKILTGFVSNLQGCKVNNKLTYLHNLDILCNVTGFIMDEILAVNYIVVKINLYANLHIVLISLAISKKCCVTRIFTYDYLSKNKSR